jgi:hypothetical protein
MKERKMIVFMLVCWSDLANAMLLMIHFIICYMRPDAVVAGLPFSVHNALACSSWSEYNVLSWMILLLGHPALHCACCPTLVSFPSIL